MSLPETVLSRRTALAALAVTGAASLAPSAMGQPASGKQAAFEHAVERLRVVMVDGDGKALNELLHDHLTYMHSSGHSQTKANLLADLAGKRFFASLTYSEPVLELIGNTGIAILTVDQVKNLPTGKTRASRIKVMQVWTTLHGHWILVARSSAIISSPVAPTCRPTEQP